MKTNQTLIGDCRETLKQIPDNFVQTCITSPPYWGLRDYGTATWEGGDENCDHQGETMRKHHVSDNKEKPREFFKNQCGKCGAIRKDSQLGLEETPEEYVETMVAVFREVKRVLRDDGTVWLNLGDTFLPNKQLGCIPFKVAMALQADGWYLRQDIIWHKPNPMPESVTDRCTKAHEYIFLLSKNKKYYFDNEAIKEDVVSKGVADSPSSIKAVDGVGGSRDNISKFKGSSKRNKRSVWTVTTKPFKEAHFATFPTDLITPCVLAGSGEGDVVLDPFMGSGTTGMVAQHLGRRWLGCELNEEYTDMQKERTSQQSLL